MEYCRRLHVRPTSTQKAEYLPQSGRTVEVFGTRLHLEGIAARRRSRVKRSPQRRPGQTGPKELFGLKRRFGLADAAAAQLTYTA
jgi:hypothetical protein